MLFSSQSCLMFRLLSRRSGRVVHQGRTKKSVVVTTRVFSANATTTTSAEESVLITTPEEHMLTFTLNRPKALNALNLDMVRLMKHGLDSNDGQKAKAIVLRGAGPKAFCAGGDVVAVRKAGMETEQKEDNLSKVFFAEEYELDYQISQLKAKTIAIMHGFVMGGGVGISIPCQYRVATPSSVFAMPEAGIGLFCDVGGSYFLPRLPGKIGLYLGLTGARLSGAQLVNAGVASHYIEDDTVLANLEQHVSQALQENGSVTETLDAVSATHDVDHELLTEINECFKGDSVEDIMATLEARVALDPDNKVAAFSLKQINKASPLSLKVIFEQIKRGKELESLKEVLEMEYTLSQNFMQDSDFFEGVNALLLEKRPAVWKHNSIADVTEDVVQSYFVAKPEQGTLNL